MCDVGYLCANFSVPIGHSVLDLGPMYATDRQTSDAHHRLMPLTRGAGHNTVSAPVGRLKAFFVAFTTDVLVWRFDALLTRWSRSSRLSHVEPG